MVPNFSHVPVQLHNTGLFDLTTHEGQAAFTDAVVSTLHGLDPNFQHLKKNPSQTHVHRHGEDSVIYLLPDGTALAVDFIGGAGGPNPRPGWMVGSHVYKWSDAHEPGDHGIGAATVVVAPVLGKAEAYKALQELNEFYMADVGLKRPGGMVRPDSEGRSVADVEAIAQWFYQIVVEQRSMEDIKAQIRQSDEWRGKHPQ